MRGARRTYGGMTVRTHLNDAQWARIAAFLEGDRGRGRLGRDDRTFVEAVLWWRRTGVPALQLAQTWQPPPLRDYPSDHHEPFFEYDVTPRDRR